MRMIVCILLAVASLVPGIFCFGVLLVSCAGHPPTTSLGMWILPLALLGAGVFFQLSAFFVKAVTQKNAGSLGNEAKLMPRKIALFIVSFSGATCVFCACCALIVFLSTKTAVSERIMDFTYAVSVGVAILSGANVYRIGKKYIQKQPCDAIHQ